MVADTGSNPEAKAQEYGKSRSYMLQVASIAALDQRL